MQILKSLAADRDLAITRPDKGNGIVLLDKSDYLQKLYEILSTPGKFTRVDLPLGDAMRKSEASAKKAALRLLEAGKISEHLPREILPSSDHHPPLFYGLAKVDEAAAPLMQILSAIGSSTHPLASWFNWVLHALPAIPASCW